MIIPVCETDTRCLFSIAPIPASSVPPVARPGVYRSGCASPSDPPYGRITRSSAGPSGTPHTCNAQYGWQSGRGSGSEKPESVRTASLCRMGISFFDSVIECSFSSAWKKTEPKEAARVPRPLWGFPARRRRGTKGMQKRKAELCLSL